MTAIPSRVFGEEWLDVWLVEVGAALGWALDGEVSEEWCGSHLDVEWFEVGTFVGCVVYN
jgi:hypothetical protein